MKKRGHQNIDVQHRGTLLQYAQMVSTNPLLADAIMQALMEIDHRRTHAGTYGALPKAVRDAINDEIERWSRVVREKLCATEAIPNVQKRIKTLKDFKVGKL